MATGGISDLERGTDETFDFLCSTCKDQNKNTEAVKFCADCHENYCSTCVKVHDTVRALRSHKIIDRVQFQPSSSVRFPTVPTERCTVHGHKPVDMFCRQHDAVGCATCMVVKHSDCKEKHYVPDYIKNNTTVVNPNETTVQLDTVVNSLAELQKEFIKEKEKLKSSKEQSLTQIQKFRNKINKRLDELERHTTNELELRFQSLTDKIEDMLTELQASASNIQSAHDSLKSAGGNTAQMFVSIKTANEVASLAQEKVNTTKSQVSSTEISFTPHQKLWSILTEIQALGDISRTETLQSKPTTADSLQVTKTQTSHESFDSQSKSTTQVSLQQVTKTQTIQESSDSQSKSTTQVSLQQVTKTPTIQESSDRQSKSTTQVSLQQVTKTPTIQESSDRQSKSTTQVSLQQVTKTPTRQQSYDRQSKPTLLKTRGYNRYTVKVKSDKQTCDIVSGCTLPDGSIILSDFWNSKLKRLDRASYAVTDYCDVPNHPWQVCVITDQEVAVCCAYGKLIQFVSIGKTLQKTRQISTEEFCSGLAYADGKLLVSAEDTSLYVYSMSGQILQQFSIDQSYYNRYIAVSSDHTKIFSATYNNGLTILDRTGQHVGQFNGAELNRARGICLHNNDSILVCGAGSQNVLQFILDGKLLGEVLKTDKPCKAVCCNKDNTKLIVGFNTNEIEVHDVNGK